MSDFRLELGSAIVDLRNQDDVELGVKAQNVPVSLLENGQVIPIALLNSSLPRRALMNSLSPSGNLRIILLHIYPVSRGWVFQKELQHDIRSPDFVPIEPLIIAQLTLQIRQVLLDLTRRELFLYALPECFRNIYQRPRCVLRSYVEQKLDRVHRPESRACEGV